MTVASSLPATSPFKYLDSADPEISMAIQREISRQQDQIEMIASENFTSMAVMEACGSVMTNKYAEGYPGRRYYGGCEYVDDAERLAIERACQLFGCSYANVQPHSGAQANQAVYLALMKPEDLLMGMSLDSGGHLTHGAKVNMSGKWLHSVTYGVDDNGYIDMEEVRRVAMEHKPKIIIAGASAYAREIDFAAFREIADACGAYLMVDMAHFAGLVAGNAMASPFPHAHVVTTTTHKTLRGPRGGMILTNDEALAKKFNSAVFPGNQGGPLMHIIAAKAVAFKEALQPEFQNYAQQILKNTKTLATTLTENGIDLVSGGTDCHLVLLNLVGLGVTGSDAEQCLERAGITCNKNGVPNDPLPPMKTSGIRLGTPAGTTRGFKEAEFKQIGKWLADLLKALAAGDASALEQETLQKVRAMCQQYPLYPEFA
ncbi:MAG: serine hydroxymethyltransferase [Alphaproteobacteria bacterium]